MFELLKNRDFRLFALKMAVFLLSVSFGFFLIKFILGHFVPLPVITTNFDRNIIYALFYTGLFFLMVKDEITGIKLPKHNFLQTAVFGAAAIAGVIIAELLVRAIFVASGASPVALIRLYYIEIFLLAAPAVLLWLSVFNLNFSKEFMAKFGNRLLITIIMFFLTAIISAALQQNWIIFSTAVAKGASFLLGLTFNSSSSASSYGTPVLSVGNFEVNIGAPCSGIESGSLFIFFYMAIVILDWKRINKKLAALLWIPGLIGMFCVNILRIYVLMLIGHLVSPKIAISIFHENAGWMFFVVYIFVFWYLAYPKIRKKE
ncbi:MAG: archaeosortase/exosortase family protein [Candidatus Nanoarchaeia archaeon]|nr:archaeosortase/exosortase family protein [Candidatus Nanoarchaeia archaeon]MDD5239640.1 archaeosortase/exosortase family protein [Candidatus Nanoarchaeia archaeon]